MVTHAPEESGLEELQRLSREIGNRGRELARGLGQARKSIEQVEKKRALWSVIRELKISMVLEELEPLVVFEIYNEVESLKHKRSTAGLNRIILKMIDELEKSLDVDDVSRLDMTAVKKKMKILSILMELAFYLQ
jgi:predicted transcriptional regulator